MIKINENTLLYNFILEFNKFFPEISWIEFGNMAFRAKFQDTYDFWLIRKNGFDYFYCSNIPARTSELLSDLNELLLAPLKIAKKTPNSPPKILASWPIELSTPDNAKLIAKSLRHILCGPLQPDIRHTIDPDMVKKLKNLVASNDRFREVPSEQQSFEFVLGKGKMTLQISVCQSDFEAVSLSTLVANYDASDRTVFLAAMTIMFILNLNFNWVRFVLRNGVIDAEVTLPVSALSYNTWHLIKENFYKALTYRDTLRIIQQPLVAEAAISVWGIKT